MGVKYLVGSVPNQLFSWLISFLKKIPPKNRELSDTLQADRYKGRMFRWETCGFSYSSLYKVTTQQATWNSKFIMRNFLKMICWMSGGNFRDRSRKYIFSVSLSLNDLIKTYNITYRVKRQASFSQTILVTTMRRIYFANKYADARFLKPHASWLILSKLPENPAF